MDPDSWIWYILRRIANEIGLKDKNGEAPVIDEFDRKTGIVFKNLNYW